MNHGNYDGTNIKVIGVGGAGGNAVEHMVRAGVNGVEFIAANTDAQALARSSADQKIGLGRTGLGAGAQPSKGQEAAMSQRGDIAQALEGAHMVFITAGMGGGTGTGAAPIVAEVARELGILTVGVVTKPFEFEGNKRKRSADEGVEELAKHVDSLIVIMNDNLLPHMGEDADVSECFIAADSVLSNAVLGIAEIINSPGLVNVDFEDVRTVMSAMGRAMMGSASANGPDRALAAANEAVSSPLLEGVGLAGARGVLVNITAAKQGLKMKEVTNVMNIVRNFAADDATIIFGAVFDESMGDTMRVTVVAAGLDQQESKLNFPGVPQAATQDGIPSIPSFTNAVPLQPAQGSEKPPVPPSRIPNVFRRPDNSPFPNVFRRANEGPPAVAQRKEPSVTSPNQSLRHAALQKNGFENYDTPAFLRKQVG